MNMMGVDRIQVPGVSGVFYGLGLPVTCMAATPHSHSLARVLLHVFKT